MKIGVDAGCLGVKDNRLKVGVYQVVVNLLEHLAKIDKKNNYLLYSFQPITPGVMKKFGLRMKNIVLRPATGWLQVRLPAEFLLHKPTVFLALGQAMPKYHPFKSIGFVYDLAFERFPECYPESLGKLRKNSQYLAKNADSLVTISESSKKDLANLYKIPQTKIKVIYPGVNPIFTARGKKKSFDKPYFLFVGALKRLKNLPTVIKAFKEFLKQSGQDYYLVIAGGDVWLDPKIKTKNHKIKILGYVPEKDLPALYHGATALITPALYEGFGLTLAEAMACGCPVVAGNTGAQPEVVGKAGILVNPKDTSAVTQAMLKLTQNSTLRQKLIRAGSVRTKLFSWSKFAYEVLKLIEQ